MIHKKEINELKQLFATAIGKNLLNSQNVNCNSEQRKAIILQMQILINKSNSIRRAIVNYFEHSPQAQYFSFLNCAVQENCHEMVDALLTAKAPCDSEEQKRVGVSALLRAAEYADLCIIQKLLDNDADPRVYNPAGSSAFHLAFLRNDPEITRAFLVKDPSLANLQSRDGLPALHGLIASSTQKNINANIQNIRLLLEFGADINASYIAPSKEEFKPIHVAVQQGFIAIISLLHKQSSAAVVQSVDKKFIAKILLTYHENSANFAILSDMLRKMGYLEAEVSNTMTNNTVATDAADINSNVNAADKIPRDLLAELLDKINSSKIVTFAELKLALDVPELQILLVICWEQKYLHKIITKLRLVSEEVLSNKDINALKEILDTHFDFIACVNRSDSKNDLSEYQFDLRQKVLEIVFRSYVGKILFLDDKVVSLKEVMLHIEYLKYYIDLAAKINDLTKQSNLFFYLFGILKHVFMIFPEIAKDFLDEYLQHKEIYDFRQINNTHHNDFINFFVLYLAKSSEPINIKAKYAQALRLLLQSREDKNAVLYILGQGICMIIDALMNPEDEYKTIMANSFVKDNNRDDKFKTLCEWDELQVLVKVIDDKAKRKKELSQQQREERKLKATEDVQHIANNKINAESSVQTAMSTSSVDHDSSSSSTTTVESSAMSIDGQPGSSSGKTASSFSFQYRTSQALYHVPKPEKKRVVQTQAPADPVQEIDEIIRLFNLPADKRDNLVKLEYRWAYFSAKPEEFSDDREYNKFFTEFKKADPHFVKDKANEQWMISLAAGNTDLRMFSKEEIRHSDGKDYRLLRFSYLDSHAGYKNKKSALY